ncbi:uncharacterized protein HD556DRAFT_1308672 [Suillus plorans]|uniref:Uncharacterized protein n=1 Tax=Suillus plorans TaxID=116603 RepID=A0A9P7AP36_9AGAM|nr:uncharacterized protein HD556DRAFT_1308672 [Suillus plorans]KAG1793548.1 hypothetical protein HD556DRAFT_1308672 [Suillus plorans]
MYTLTYHKASCRPVILNRLVPTCQSKKLLLVAACRGDVNKFSIDECPLKGALGTGKNTVAQRSMLMQSATSTPMKLDIRANDFADAETLAIEWNVVVIHRGDKCIKVMIQALESPGCICLRLLVLTDKQQTLLRRFSTVLMGPNKRGHPKAWYEPWLSSGRALGLIPDY